MDTIIADSALDTVLQIFYSINNNNRFAQRHCKDNLEFGFRCDLYEENLYHVFKALPLLNWIVPFDSRKTMQYESNKVSKAITSDVNFDFNK